MQFEALLVTEILKEVREASSGGWLSGDGDSSGAAMTEIAESQLAQALSSGAGFGLAKSIEQQLTPLATKIPKGPFVVAKP
jgi:Rod binding domain-containing protein